MVILQIDMTEIEEDKLKEKDMKETGEGEEN